MAKEPAKTKTQTPSDLSAFLQKYRIPQDKFFERGLDWTTLKNIGEHHAGNCKRLEPTANSILEQLRNVPEIHSLKMRLKSPEHLMEKIVRKSLEQPDLNANVENYHAVITDRIGLRALHLFKGDWKPIHDFVRSTWDLHEPPIAYIRKGDAPDLVDKFKAADCDVREHQFGYRSIHYLLKSQPTKELTVAELQVRTIFEEGWSEIDHRIRYPYDMDNSTLAQFLVIFNRLAGGADEMGTFVQALSHELKQYEAKYLESEAARKAKESDLKQAIDKLTIEQKEKERLKKEVEELRKASAPTWKAGAVLADLKGITYSIPTVISSTAYISSLPQKKCDKCGSLYEPGSIILGSVGSAVPNLCSNCRFS